MAGWLFDRRHSREEGLEEPQCVALVGGLVGRVGGFGGLKGTRWEGLFGDVDC